MHPPFHAEGAAGCQLCKDTSVNKELRIPLKPPSEERGNDANSFLSLSKICGIAVETSVQSLQFVHTYTCLEVEKSFEFELVRVIQVITYGGTTRTLPCRMLSNNAVRRNAASGLPRIQCPPLPVPQRYRLLWGAYGVPFTAMAPWTMIFDLSNADGYVTTLPEITVLDFLNLSGSFIDLSHPRLIGLG